MLILGAVATTLFVLNVMWLIFSDPMVGLLTALTATNESRRYRLSVVLAPAQY